LSITQIPGGSFRSDPHRYDDEHGNFVPSLTQVLKLQGLSDFSGADPEDLANAARRGDLLHGVVEAYNRDKEGLDPCWITEEIEGYFNGFLAFERDTGFKVDPSWTERPMIATINGMPIGLKPDCFGKIGRYDAVVELKAASSIQPSWSVQTAMQELAIYKSQHVGRARRFALQLFKDGRYKLHPHLNHQEDERIGIEALSLTWWRLRQGQKLWTQLAT
jgi:hypothetical protein